MANVSDFRGSGIGDGRPKPTRRLIQPGDPLLGLSHASGGAVRTAGIVPRLASTASGDVLVAVIGEEEVHRIPAG